MPSSGSAQPKIEDYATVEARCDGIPVYAFGYTYVYGVSPDLLPGTILQEDNRNPMVKLRPKKSWEINHNLCGSTPAREPKTMWNDDQPLLPIHLIDGDPETAWSSRGGTCPDTHPEWIRIDLPAESVVSSIALVCSEQGPGAHGQCGSGLKPGKALPGELTVKLSRDAKQWDTVYENANFSGPEAGPTVVEFPAQSAKQVWIIGRKLRPVQNWGPCFSVGEVQVRSPSGENLALVSRGAGVTVSSTYYGYGMDRFTQAMLWPLQYDLGFKWTRVGYDMGMYLWQYVEREKGKLQIDPRADEAISDAWRNGVKVILCLDKANWLYHDPPRKVDWTEARTREMMETYYDHPGWPDASPEMLAGWLRYVDYMVRHFKDRVAYLEICNEWQGIGAERYIELVKATIPVIKTAAPEARIMLGSTTGFDREAILACLRAGLAPHLDVVAWHPFYQTDPDAPAYRSYRDDVKAFKLQCAALGFTGRYAATEWTWAAPYPGTAQWCSEMQKAKYAAQLMTAHCGMDIISLYNETFQTGKIDWDVTLLRNSSFQVDPITPAQPQPIYYALRTLSTVLDDFRPAEFPIQLSSKVERDCYRFARGEKELLVAVWIPGRASDGVREEKCHVTFPGLRVKSASAIDTMNGTEQRLEFGHRGGDTVVEGLLIKDYPVCIQVTW